MKEIIYSILFGIVAVVGIVWGIWYENFSGENPEMSEQANLEIKGFEEADFKEADFEETD